MWRRSEQQRRERETERAKCVALRSPAHREQYILRQQPPHVRTPKTMKGTDAAQCGDGTVANIGVKMDGKFHGNVCRQKFDMEKAVQLQRKFIHDHQAERQCKVAVEAFLKEHGFSSVSAPKRTFTKTTYPLHMAVKIGDPLMAAMLLAEGADPVRKDSSGKTASQLAWTKSAKGSHAGAGWPKELLMSTP